MAKLRTGTLQGTRNRDNSVNGTSGQTDGMGSNQKESQSASDNGNPTEHREKKDIQHIQGEKEHGEGNTKAGKDSPLKTTGAGDPVNMATGEYIYEDKDFILPDMGGEYSLTRRYTGP